MKRLLPWSLAGLAYVVPPLWAHHAIERDIASQVAAYGWACGTTAFGIALLACIVSGLLSAIATGLRGTAVGWWTGASFTTTGIELAALLLPLAGTIIALWPFLS